MHRLKFQISLIILMLALSASGQSLDNIGITKDTGAKMVSLILDDSTTVNLPAARPLFSFRLDGVYFESDDVPAGLTGNRFIMIYPGGVEAGFTPRGGSHPGFNAELVFRNNWNDTLVISDVVPFGENSNNVFITGHGPARSCKGMPVPSRQKPGTGSFFLTMHGRWGSRHSVPIQQYPSALYLGGERFRTAR